MDAADLRPLGVGETLDAGIKIYRRRFQSLFRVVAVVTAPVAVINALVYLSVGGHTTTTTTTGTVSGRDAAVVGGAAFITGIIGLLATELSVAACYEIVAGDYLDRSPTWRESLGAAWHRLRSIMWVAILHFVLASLALVGCIVPGVYLWMAWLVAIPVLLLEDKRGMKALSRSRELISGRWWPVFGTYLVLMIMTGIVSSAVQGVLVGVASQGNDTAYTLVRAIASAGSSILVTPLTSAVVMVIYFDLRVRKEGFDLELLARGIGVDPPPAAKARFDAVDDIADEEPPFWPPPPGWQPGRRRPE